MASRTTTKYTVQMKLNNGSTASGGIRTVSVSLGKLSLTGYTETSTTYGKVLSICNALEDCFSKSLHEIVETRTSRLEDE